MMECITLAVNLLDYLTKNIYIFFGAIDFRVFYRLTNLNNRYQLTDWNPKIKNSPNSFFTMIQIK